MYECMKSFLKYIGVTMQILGVLVLAIPFFTRCGSNQILTVGCLTVIGGFIIHILICRKNS